jgi:succinate-semialdehyde dehydrogenase / glutarate-semialdehyde dehydrogenase
MSSVRTAFDERLLIGGAWVDAVGGGRFEVSDPATGGVVGSVPDAG